MNSKNSQQIDALTDFVCQVAKYLGIIFILPYQEFWRRFKRWNLKIVPLLLVIAICAAIFKYYLDPLLYSYYADSPIFQYLFSYNFMHFYRKSIFVYLIFHIFYSVLGCVYSMEKRRLEKALYALGYHDEDKKKLKLLYKKKMNNLLTVYGFRNPNYEVKEFDQKRGRLTTAFKTNLIADIRYQPTKKGEFRNVIEIVCRKEGFPKMYDFKQASSGNLKEYEFILGETATGGRLTLSLPAMIHMVIAGASGMGKSSFYRQMICSLLLRSKNIIFYLIDLKGGVEFNIFDGIKNVHVFNKPSTASSHLRKLIHEVDRRTDILKKAKVPSIDEYSDSKKMPRILIIVDEAAELFSSKSQMSQDKEAMIIARTALSKIARQARAVGIHVVFGSQRIDKHVIPSDAKDNFGTRLSFKVNSIDSSSNMFQSKVACDLDPVRGRAIYRDGMKLRQIQTPFLSFNEAKEILKEFVDSDPNNVAEQSDNASEEIPLDSDQKLLPNSDPDENS